MRRSGSEPGLGRRVAWSRGPVRTTLWLLVEEGETLERERKRASDVDMEICG